MCVRKHIYLWTALSSSLRIPELRDKRAHLVAILFKYYIARNHFKTIKIIIQTHTYVCMSSGRHTHTLTHEYTRPSHFTIYFLCCLYNKKKYICAAAANKTRDESFPHQSLEKFYSSITFRSINGYVSVDVRMPRARAHMRHLTKLSIALDGK